MYLLVFWKRLIKNGFGKKKKFDVPVMYLLVQDAVFQAEH